MFDTMKGVENFVHTENSRFYHIRALNNKNVKEYYIESLLNTNAHKFDRHGVIKVNSFHHQAIKNVAKYFKVIATSEDGIIEAIEYNNIIGVQWHPEQMMDIEFFRKYIELFF